LSAPRFARYLQAAGGDRGLALELYEWNACAAAAMQHDLAHLEIGLRNAYDRVLTAARPDEDWTDPAGPLFAPLLRAHGGRSPADVNERSRELLVSARRQAGGGAAHGKVVAELTFGFWRYLSSAAHEKTLWVPYLHRAFCRGTDRRRDVDEPMAALTRLRNRAAHHECLLAYDLPSHHTALLVLAGRLGPDLGIYLKDVARTPACLTRRPCP